MTKLYITIKESENKEGMICDLINNVRIVLGTSDQSGHVFGDRQRPKTMSMPIPIPRKEMFECEVKNGIESKRKKGRRVVLKG